jgi:phosphoribosylformimino-5-aminoimidazole carboxamide ribotide isomerase
MPAIDLIGSEVVRLTQGDPNTLKVYKRFGGLIEVARKWEREGADAIHVVDLDAALDAGSNLESIKKIAYTVGIPVQVGGGIRTLEAAKTILEFGVNRVILGSLAFKEPVVLAEIMRSFGQDRVVVALDHRKGEVMVRGWRDAVGLKVEEAMTRFLGLGVQSFLITSVRRDGTLLGPDLDTLSRVCGQPQVAIIAAGGVGGLEDLEALRVIGVEGVVIGKALYEGVFELREALEVARRG